MTIQIDDAGWGSLIGGVLIAGLRLETDEFAVADIGVEYFQGDAFARKTYLGAAVEATQKVLEDLKSPSDEAIEICSGYVHEDTRAWLTGSGRPWRVVKVGGRLQELIEAAFADYLRRLGFPYDGSTENYGALFYKAVVWLKDGKPERAGMNAEKVRVAKTGWDSFPFYRDHPYRRAKILAQQSRSRRSFARWRGEEE